MTDGEIDPTARATTSNAEAVARARLDAAGWDPVGPWPGRMRDNWPRKCRTCGRIAWKPTTRGQVKPCSHPIRFQGPEGVEWRKRLAEQKEQEQKDAKRRRTGVPWPVLLLQRKGLVPLEPWPGEGQLWPVQCKWCGRKWQVPEDRPRACPHSGRDGGVWDPPSTAGAERPAPAPLAVAADLRDVTLTPYERYAHLVGPWDGHGPYRLLVNDYARHRPDSGDWRVMYEGRLNRPDLAEAEALLRNAGWIVDADAGWTVHNRTYEVTDSWWVPVTSPLMTCGEIARDVLGTKSKDPVQRGRGFVRKHRLAMRGSGVDAAGQKWELYLRADAQAAQRR